MNQTAVCRTNLLNSNLSITSLAIDMHSVRPSNGDSRAAVEILLMHQDNKVLSKQIHISLRYIR
jgi:hypothetical protein